MMKDWRIYRIEMDWQEDQKSGVVLPSEKTQGLEGNSPEMWKYPMQKY